MADISRNYYFLSKSGEMLPRWREAFPHARICSVDAPFFPVKPALVWVHAPAGSNWQAVIESLHTRWPELPVVVLSNVPSDEEALRCFSLSARGYVNTYAVPELLKRVAEVVLNGGLWIGESLMQKLLQGLAGFSPVAPVQGVPESLRSLTERELEVAKAVAQGASNKEVARQLGITERTVKAHSSAIFEKLGVRDRLQLSLLVHGHQIS